LLTILKCPTCGRVFAYYGEGTSVLCPKYSYCNTKIEIGHCSVLPITVDAPNASPDKMRNWARVFVNAFNNTSYLAAEVWSEDGHNSIIISLLESKLGVTHNEVLQMIPPTHKHASAWDGIIIESGKYSLYGGDNKLADKISAQIRVLPEEPVPEVPKKPDQQETIK